MFCRVACTMLTGALLAATLSCAGASGPAASALPDTPAGRTFRDWLDAYNAADSARLDAYAGEYEPRMSVHTQLVFRRQTGPWYIATIERSEPRHLEVVLETRAVSTVGLVPLSMYGAVDVTDGRQPRATTSFSYLGKGPRMRLPRIAAGQRALAIDSVIAKTVRNYLYLSVAHEVADSLRARQTRGAYDDYPTEVSFAQRLNRDLRELASDQQLGVEYAWRVPLPMPTPTPPAMLHCGVDPARELADGVGYVRFYGFRDPELDCGHEVSEVMNAIAGADALVVDLRDNAGGSRDMMAYLASYLVGSCTHLGDIWDRRTAVTEERWTIDGLPGPAFGGTKPLYLLTSARTFATAEELAYDLQSLGRATVVGERTAGAAEVAGIGPVGARMLIHVPFARVINPITKTNWSGRGVKPDVIVPASEALATARQLAKAGRTPRVALASLAPMESMQRPGFARGIRPEGPPRVLRGIQFSIDTIAPDGKRPGMLSRVAGVVEFADGRGRLDVTSVSRAPDVAVNGVTVAEPLASPGDYYLFDNTEFLLVRPSTRTFSRFVITRADFNFTGALLPGAFMMPNRPIHSDSLLTGDAVTQRQHAPVGIQWHMQPRNGGPPVGGAWNMYARGWLEIEDAPASEAGVARWFEVAAALATRPEDVRAIPPDGVEVTSIALFHRPGVPEAAARISELLALRSLTAADVAPARLVLPSRFTETRWPGFEHVRGVPVPSGPSAARWRVLEDTASQRARAACRQPWLPERMGGNGPDTRISARPLARPAGLR